MTSVSSSLTGPANVLALVVDIPPHLVLLDGGPHHYLNSILAFANIHLAASVNRKLCIVAATNQSTEFLYPDQEDYEQVSRLIFLYLDVILLIKMLFQW